MGPALVVLTTHLAANFSCSKWQSMSSDVLADVKLSRNHSSVDDALRGLDHHDIYGSTVLIETANHANHRPAILNRPVQMIRLPTGLRITLNNNTECRRWQQRATRWRV